MALLKLLLAVAWADGQVQAPELNFLKRLALRLGLDDDVWVELEPYLEEPVEEAERLDLARDLLDRLRTPGRRREVLRMLEEISAADQDVSAEERQALEDIRGVLESADGSAGLMSGLRRLFGGGGPGRASTQMGRDVELFLHNKVLYRLRRDLRQRQAEVHADEERLSYWALFGGLLGRIVGADQQIRTEETRALRRILEARTDLAPEHLELVVSIVAQEALRGLDRHRLIQGFLEVSRPEERRQLVDCLFDVATADGSLPREEHEEIRAIAYGLGLAHREFIASKVRYTPRLRHASPPP